MSHEKIIKYIKSQFKNIVNDKLKYYEQHICNFISKSKDQYTLKNPILRKNCIIDSLKELDIQPSAENNECIKDLEESVLSRPSVDNDCFEENIHLHNNLNILSIKKINK